MPNMRGYHSDFLNDLDILLVEDSPTLEELEIQAFGIHIWFTVLAGVLIY